MHIGKNEYTIGLREHGAKHRSYFGNKVNAQNMQICKWKEIVNKAIRSAGPFVQPNRELVLSKQAEIFIYISKQFKEYDDDDDQKQGLFVDSV